MTTLANFRLAALPLSFLWIIIFVFIAHPVSSAQVYTTIPKDIDRSAKYLFFLHNYYVEIKGVDGDCKYNDLLQAFAKEDQIVISEVRTGKIVPCTYASKVSAQVEELVSAGVPPQNITVSGHSKGGAIALCVSSQLKNNKINYVIMAGCEIAGIKKYKMYPDFTNLQGRILSVYANSDTVAGSCSNAFSMATDGLSDTELVLNSEKGHKLFFTPDSTWLIPVLRWVNE